MTLIPKFPKGLHDPRDVKIFNKETKSIWHQERALLNHPLCDFRQYTFSGVSTVVKTLVAEYLAVPCAVPNLDDEQIVNSGGLILPTDRFLSVYDVNPNILSVVEWPSGSGNLFTVQRKEWNPVSGRCEMLIRQDNHLKGVVYRKVISQTFVTAEWKTTETVKETVIAVNRSELNFEEQLQFSGVAAVGDIVFWCLKSSLQYIEDINTFPNVLVPFIPSIGDSVVDADHLGNTEVYRIVSTRFDAEEDFYRLLCRRYEETK